MTLKNNRAPLQCFFKLCASFGSHLWIQTGVTVRKRLIWVKIDDFFSCVTLKFDVWPWKTIGHLFYIASSFVHHFIIIGEFKLELQFGNAQFGSKSTLFLAVWPRNFDLWHWKTIGHLFYATSSFAYHVVAIGEFKLELQSGSAQSGWNSTIFFSHVTLKFDGWPWKTRGYLSKQHQAVCIISSSYVNSNWSYSPETVKLGFDLCDLDLWLLTLTFCMDLTLVIGNNSWKFHDDTMRVT